MHVHTKKKERGERGREREVRLLESEGSGWEVNSELRHELRSEPGGTERLRERERERSKRNKGGLGFILILNQLLFLNYICHLNNNKNAS